MPISEPTSSATTSASEATPASSPVPEVETTVLPLRSSSFEMLEAFFATYRFAVTKCVIVKATCFWRSRLLVVEPHSRSIVPFAISGMRVAEVTGFSLTSIFGILSSVFTASTIFMQRSIA
jgi:hypothetical protein